MEVEPEACEVLGEARDDDASWQEETEGEEHEDTMSLRASKEERGDAGLVLEELVGLLPHPDRG